MNSLVGRLVKRGVVGAIGQRWEAVTPRPDGSVLVIEIAKRLNDAETMVKPAVRPRGTDGLVPTRALCTFYDKYRGRMIEDVATIDAIVKQGVAQKQTQDLLRSAITEEELLTGQW